METYNQLKHHTVEQHIGSMFLVQFILFHFLMLLSVLGLFWIIVQKSLTIDRFLKFSVYGFGVALFLSYLIGFTVQMRAIGQRFAEALFFEGALFLVLCLLAPKKNHKCLWTIFLFCLSLLFVEIGIFSLYVEPTRLTVAHYEIVSDKVSEPIRIVLLSDIQADNPGNYEREVLKKAQMLEPDLILFGGDYLQPFPQTAEPVFKAFNSILQESHLHAPLGMYAVLGNHDIHWHEKIFQLFQDTDIQVLIYTQTLILKKGTTKINLTLLSLAYSGMTDKKTFPSSGNFHIMLGHNPSFAGGEIDVDLALAGHTHGGQVCIPGFGPLITFAPGIPRSWGKGRTEIKPGQTLIVSNGLGMERGLAPRIRFFCPPQIVVINIRP